MGIYTTKILEEKEFNLGEAIRNDEVDLIFGENDELINEAFKVNSNNLKILIRNLYEDGMGEHWMSIKLITPRKDPLFYHEGKAGIPITFTEDKNDWKVYLGGNPQKISNAKKIQSKLNKREIIFITSVINELGDLILEYWNLNPKDPIQYNRMREIQQYCENKYYRSK